VALYARRCRLDACRCATLFRGLHHLLTCSIPSRGGPDSDSTWETGRKRRWETEVEKRCSYLASTTLLGEILFYYFPVRNTENDRVKNWKCHAFSRLTEGDANNALPIWHSCIFGSFWYTSLSRSNPARRICSASKGKRLRFSHHIVKKMTTEKMPSCCLDSSLQFSDLVLGLSTS